MLLFQRGCQVVGLLVLLYRILLLLLLARFVFVVFDFRKSVLFVCACDVDVWVKCSVC